jgi:hypothetical protein
MQFGTQGLDAPPPAISHILYVSGYKGGLVAIPPPIAKKGGEKKVEKRKEKKRGKGAAKFATKFVVSTTF